MNYIDANSVKTAKLMIEILVNSELSIMPKEGTKIIGLNSLIIPLPNDGIVYKIMDEVCEDLVQSGWNCYYHHYYTMVRTLTLIVSLNELPEDKLYQLGKYKFVAPLYGNWFPHMNKDDQKYFPKLKGE